MELKEARIAANYTQQEAADQLGISRPTYIAMEKNPGRVKVDVAFQLAELFGVSVDDIFFANDCK